MTVKNDYIERIALSRLFLVVTSKLYKKGFIKQELDSTLEAFNDYVDSDDFGSLSIEDKNKAAMLMLCDTINTALPYFNRACDAGKDKNKDKSCEITATQASELLEKLYKADENGDNDLINMNINEWVEKSGIVVVNDPKDEIKGN